MLELLLLLPTQCNNAVLKYRFIFHSLYNKSMTADEIIVFVLKSARRVYAFNELKVSVFSLL